MRGIASLLKSFRLLALALIAGFVVACDSRPITQDDLDEGIQKIDEGRFDKAIEELADLSYRDLRPDVRVALATAYVGRAGLEIADYWELVRLLQTEPVNEETIQADPEYQRNRERLEPVFSIVSSDLDEDIDQALQLFTSLQLYYQRVQTLPYIEKEQRPDVERGIEILDGIETQGGRFYRAILIVTLLRSDIEDGFDIWDSLLEGIQRNLSDPFNSDGLFYEPVTGDFTEWLLEPVS